VLVLSVQEEPKVVSEQKEDEIVFATRGPQTLVTITGREEVEFRVEKPDCIHYNRSGWKSAGVCHFCSPAAYLIEDETYISGSTFGTCK
jgi:hypothetical protein